MTNWAKVAQNGNYLPKKRKRWVRPETIAKRKAKRNAKKQGCVVYGLYDGGGNLRYIGQTRTSIERRFFFHMKTASEHPNYALSRWLLEEPQEIHVIDHNATWDVSEIIYIERARVAGDKLLNKMRGGGDSAGALKREKSESFSCLK